MIEHAVQAAGAHFGGILQLETARGGVARVGEGLQFSFGALRIEALERRERHVDLAADFEFRGDALPVQLARDGRDVYYVAGDVVAFGAVAARQCAKQAPVAVSQADGGAVEFQFARKAVGRTDGLADALVELKEFLARVRVAERKHRPAVRDLDEIRSGRSGRQVAADMPRGAVLRGEFRVHFLESLEFAHQQVEFKIGDGGCVQHIIVVVVPFEFPLEEFDPFPGRRFIDSRHISSINYKISEYSLKNVISLRSQIG